MMVRVAVAPLLVEINHLAEIEIGDAVPVREAEWLGADVGAETL